MNAPLLQPFGDPLSEANGWIERFRPEAVRERDPFIYDEVFELEWPDMCQTIGNYAQLIYELERMLPHLPQIAAYLEHARKVHAFLTVWYDNNKEAHG